jgi:hypothetical protein
VLVICVLVDMGCESPNLSVTWRADDLCFAIDEGLRGCILIASRLLIEEKIAFGKSRGNELGADDRR